MADTNPTTSGDTGLPHYRAFVSYRHADVDSAVAEAVQHGLERFWVPKQARGADGSPHIAPVFRDKEELPVSSRLGDDITEALRVADALVVICSPRTAESSWVAREIDTFLTWHDQDRVFVVLAEGEPYDVIPERLLYETLATTDPDGTTHEERVEIEPLACDFRNPARSWRRTELTRLAAAILGVSFDSLMRRAQRRRTRIIASVAAVITTVACGIAAYALWSNARIAESYRQTQINESEALAVEAQELLAAGDRMEAIQVALAALPERSTSTERPFVPAAQIALQDAVQAYPSERFWRSRYATKGVSDLCATSAGGLAAYVKTDDTLLVGDLATGAELCTISLPDTLEATTDVDSALKATNLAFCGEKLLCTVGYAGRLALFDPTDGHLLWDADLEMPNNSFDRQNTTPSNDGSLVATGYCRMFESEQERRETVVSLLDATDGSVRARYHLSLAHVSDANGLSSMVSLAFSPDDKALAVSCTGTIWRIDLETGTTTEARLSQKDAYALTYLDDAIVSISCTNGRTSLLLGTAYLDAFACDLTPLWSRQETPPTYYDELGVYHLNFAYVVGSYEREGLAPQLVYVTGREVRFVDQASGSPTASIQASSPIRACTFRDGMLHMMDYEGTLSSRYVKNPADGDEGSVLVLSSLPVVEGEYGTIVLADDIPYALAWDSAAGTYRTYLSARHATGTPGLQPYDTLEDSEVRDLYQPSADTSYLVCSDEQELHVLGQDSLEPLWSASYQSLGFDEEPAVSYAGDSLLLYTKYARDDAYAVAEVSLATGEVSARLTLPCASYGRSGIRQIGICTLDDEPTLYLLLGGHLLCFFSRDGMAQRPDIEVPDHDLQSVTIVGDTVLTLYDEHEHGHFELLSLADGQPVEAEVTDLTIASAYHSARVVRQGDDGKRMTIYCSNGRLCCMDTATWTVLWEQELPNLRIAEFSDDGNLLLAQDNTGRCLLLSAETGQTLRSSSVQLPLISGFVHDADDPRQLHAVCTKTGLSRPETTYVVLSLDEDAFGPTTMVYSGVFYVRGENLVITHDPLLGDWNTCPLRSLDELIELGHETVQGHELTDVERHLYRIAG